MKRYTPKPVMVIVDVRSDDERQGAGGGIPTDAYFAVEEIKDVSAARGFGSGCVREWERENPGKLTPEGTPPPPPAQDGTSSQKTFVHVPSSIEAEEAEEIGVEHLLRDVKSLSAGGGALSSRVSDQLSSLKGLGTRLLEIKDYLEQVVEGKLPVNHQIVYNLQDVFNLLPNLDHAAAAAAPREEEGAGVKRPFTVATNDQLLVMYLSSLIRAVIALHDLVCRGVSLSFQSGGIAYLTRPPRRFSTSKQRLTSKEEGEGEKVKKGKQKEEPRRMERRRRAMTRRRERARQSRMRKRPRIGSRATSRGISGACVHVLPLSIYLSLCEFLCRVER